MSIYATARPAPAAPGKHRRVCWRCGIEHTGRQDMCIDCRDVEHPKPCKNGHERTEDNVYIPKSGRPQCGACKRVTSNRGQGWLWSCQVCGRRADQGEPLCPACGQTSETTPLSYRLGDSKTAPESAVNASEGLTRLPELAERGLAS